jgi:hypothetical protein
MFHSLPGAILVTDVAHGAALLPALARRRPDLQWQLFTGVAPAVFKACGGGFELAVVDADCVQPGFELLLQQVERCAPDTRLLVRASDPRRADLADVAACGWLQLVSAAELDEALEVSA